LEQYRIEPRTLAGNIAPPPSKSLAHRAIICGALAKGQSVIENVAYSQDILATIKGMQAVGAKIIQDGSTLKIEGGHMDGSGPVIDCNESGSTLRFMIPVLLAGGGRAKFVGGGQLGARPLDPYYSIFKQDGVSWESIDHPEKDGVKPLELTVEGRLRGGCYRLPGNVSSQFVSGLLFALPLISRDSVIEIEGGLESKSYVDLTLDTLSRFGVVAHNQAYERIAIEGGQAYQPSTYKVEGDFSQAAFYLCAAALGNSIVTKGLNFHSLQGDRTVLHCLEQMGCQVHFIGDSVSVTADQIHGAVIDGAQIPDALPVLTVVCALAKGESRIVNAGRLRIKECDRLAAMAENLTILGAQVKELEDGLIIQGVDRLTGGAVNSFNDHRIAMSMAVAATRCAEDVLVSQPSSVLKSYPNFWEDYTKLGGIISG